MSHAKFVHLRVRSAYSLLDGALHAPDIVDLAKSNDMPALAVVDNRNLFGALEFSMKATGAGIQPITGVILPISRDQVEIDSSQRRPPADDLVLLAQDQTGYANLMKLVSNAYLSSDGDYDPEIKLDNLEGNTAGLIALTGGPNGAINRLIRENQFERAETRLNHLKRLFPNRLYAELQLSLIHI